MKRDTFRELGERRYRIQRPQPELLPRHIVATHHQKSSCGTTLGPSPRTRSYSVKARAHAPTSHATGSGVERPGHPL
jgi:hypothetical protein